MAGYSSRAHTYTSGDTILATHTNDEFDTIIAAFNASTGHNHDGTTGEGARVLITDTTGGTQYGIPLLNGAGSQVTSTAAFTAGQILVGQSTAVPEPKTLSGDATLAATGAITLHVSVVKSVPTDSGTATATANAVTIAGGEGIDTSASGTTVTIAAEDASTTNKGVVELATDAETLALTDTARAVTPSNLGALDASTTQVGLVELATDAETLTGTDTARALTPSNLTAKLATPGAIGGSTPAAITGTTITANTKVVTDTIDEKTAAAGVTVDSALIKDGYPHFSTKKPQSFLIALTNSGGSIQHRIGEDENFSSVGLSDKINGASTSFAVTPTGADSSTAFTSGAKISSASTYVVILDTGDIPAGELFGMAVIESNSTGDETLRVRLLVSSGNVNGVTQRRLCLAFSDDAANYSINTTNITNGQQINVRVLAYLP